MTQRFFVDTNGAFIGSYDGPDETMPSNLIEQIEVLTAPEDGRQVWKDGAWLPYTPPPMVALIWAVHLWERMTPEEAEAVGVEMEKQDFRTRMIFNRAASFRSDHPLWPVLHTLAAALFPPERVDAILEPSEFVAP